MIENTINDDKTIAGGGAGAILAGRYHIIRQLGQGGMGSVWLAEDRQLDNRKVAIKMLPSIIVTDKRAYQQLKSEALVSLKLVHPNIVTLRVFEENDGAPFLVMDYIEGRTLSDYLAEKGKLSEAETIKLLKPIAAALDYAHSEKVIHRDVKPSNIIIRNDGHPFILDFGIAREIQESMTRMTGRTISGTLLYMSPEQLRGAPPTPAQDIYSFAATVYECLTGKPPFYRGHIEYQILNENPAALPNSFAIATTVMAGLSKRIENRPLSCIDICVCYNVNSRDVSNNFSYKDLSDLFVVCEVVSCKRHPSRERLRVVEVFDGDKILQIVTGAPNCRKGLRTALAKIGAIVPPCPQLGSHSAKSFTVKRGTLGGVYSNGMLCSPMELCFPNGKHDGIVEFSSNVPIGMLVRDALSYWTRKVVYDCPITEIYDGNRE